MIVEIMTTSNYWLDISLWSVDSTFEFDYFQAKLLYFKLKSGYVKTKNRIIVNHIGSDLGSFT